MPLQSSFSGVTVIDGSLVPRPAHTRQLERHRPDPTLTDEV